METGSTAIHDALHAFRKALLSRGIGAYHVLARALHQQMDQVLTQERETDHPVVLLSSEFFGQVPPIHPPDPGAISSGSTRDSRVQAVTRDLPQPLPPEPQGQFPANHTVRMFLNNQLLLDRDPDGDLGRQVMNAPVLDARLRSAGCHTHWISYDRQALL